MGFKIRKHFYGGDNFLLLQGWQRNNSTRDWNNKALAIFSELSLLHWIHKDFPELGLDLIFAQCNREIKTFADKTAMKFLEDK